MMWDEKVDHHWRQLGVNNVHILWPSWQMVKLHNKTKGIIKNITLIEPLLEPVHAKPRKKYSIKLSILAIPGIISRLQYLALGSTTEYVKACLSESIIKRNLRSWDLLLLPALKKSCCIWFGDWLACWPLYSNLLLPLHWSSPVDLS